MRCTPCTSGPWPRRSGATTPARAPQRRPSPASRGPRTGAFAVIELFHEVLEPCRGLVVQRRPLRRLRRAKSHLLFARPRVHNDPALVLEMVEGDHEINEQETGLRNAKVVLGGVGDLLELPDEIVGKVAYGPARERRQSGNRRACGSLPSVPAAFFSGFRFMVARLPYFPFGCDWKAQLDACRPGNGRSGKDRPSRRSSGRSFHARARSRAARGSAGARHACRASSGVRSARRISR